MTGAMKQVLTQQDTYRSIWQQMYEPVRKVLAGSWLKMPEGSRYELSFDQDGGYTMRCFETHSLIEGRYTIIGVDGQHYVSMDYDGQPWVLKIEDIQEHSLVLRTLVEFDRTLEFTRRFGQASIPLN